MSQNPQVLLYLHEELQQGPQIGRGFWQAAETD